jgi:hypothetical protein
MSTHAVTGGLIPSMRYRITVEGRLTHHLGSAFEGFALEAGHQNSVLVGEIRDQADLFGVLDRVRNLGLNLVSVQNEPECQSG